MYGPDGVGVLYLDSALHALLKPVGIGGGAIKSLSFIPESSEMNFDLISPLSALKSGTKNLSGVLGLSTAVDFIKEIGFEKIIQHEFELMNLLIDGLLKIEGIKIYGPTNLNHRSGLVSFSIEGINMNELTDYFVNKNFCIRYGS